MGGSGSAQLTYTPSSIQAAAGDRVRFTFQAKNHTATQSTFAAPCARMAGGADSGFRPNPDGMANPAPWWDFTVADTKPTCTLSSDFATSVAKADLGTAGWYCAQKGHCGMGMVFSINPTADKSMDAFTTAAKAQGMAMAAAPAPAPPASTMPAAMATQTAQSGAAPSGTAMTGVVPGMMDAKGSCSCFCGVGAFPAAEQGVGMMGGYPGAVPTSGAM